MSKKQMAHFSMAQLGISDPQKPVWVRPADNNSALPNKLSPAEMTRRRHFNTNEREALFILSGGHCVICRNPLTDDWEPDHIVPWSAGGLTDVTNGQAVCRACNRKKGGKHNADS